MSPDVPPHLALIVRYPVKGLSPEALDRVDVRPGETLPFDRAFAIENGAGRFDPHNPQYLPKINFLMLMRNERLAGLETKFDPETQRLTISRGGRQVAAGDLSAEIGRKMIEQFLAAYMQAELRGAPKVVSAPGHSFSDVADKVVHVVNLASLRDLERRAGRPLDPLRFRANLYLEGVPAWVEKGWVGKELGVGGVRLKVTKTTTRCAATEVDPKTAKRDIAVPALLERELGAIDFGVYARVSTAGQVAVGDRVDLPA